MASLLTGVHHVTAFAKDPQKNVDFYTRVLGYRLVKKTVNFDDPTMYHMYYGDDAGTPGTLLTHFPHPHAKMGVHGSPEIVETVLRVDPGSLDAWTDRLAQNGIVGERGVRHERDVVLFGDHDGMRYVLLEGEGPDRGIDGVVVKVGGLGDSVAFLRTALGFDVLMKDGEKRAWLTLGDGGSENRIELVEGGATARGRFGAGVVHHVAWRVPDEATQAEVAARVTSAGVGVTPVKDRQYFKSIYFRIPGGVIFEVATDGPGFTVDEPRGSLGERLCLPPMYEGRRAEIERSLPAVRAGVTRA